MQDRQLIFVRSAAACWFRTRTFHEEMRDRTWCTKRRPTKTELRAMLFGWRVVKHVKSNAIVYAKADRTLGIGAGQMSRVDASRIAIWKAEEAGLSLKGSAVASDAFFPFPGRIDCRGRGGRNVRHSTRRISPRRRSHCRRRTSATWR